ncbi:hypothetical protein LOTGIDRAFT_157278 [Lottia gigantea]|uniref:Uncharacterized protein n=1 Tax=Lottia gigantea TaxID=225164 RepID=V4B8L4_LOTGI|nr:hypothetical protein LOTGIDRAFT_157278 [Lottia gigantea]ESP02127.1 hypothetical protein LOTGIDRAFT_157278 [Lottia gigantea]
MGEIDTDLFLIKQILQDEENSGDVLKNEDDRVPKSEEDIPFDDTSGTSVDPPEFSANSLKILEEKPLNPIMSVNSTEEIGGMQIVGLIKSNVENCDTGNQKFRTSPNDLFDSDSQQITTNDTSCHGVDNLGFIDSSHGELLDCNRNSIDCNKLDHLTVNMDCDIKMVEQQKLTDTLSECEKSAKNSDNDHQLTATGQLKLAEIKRGSIEQDSTKEQRYSSDIPLPSILHSVNLISATLFSKTSECEGTDKREINPLVIVAGQSIEDIDAIETKESEQNNEISKYLCNKSPGVEKSDILSNHKKTCEKLPRKHTNQLVHKPVSYELTENFKFKNNLNSKDSLQKLSHLNIDVSGNLVKQIESFYDDKSPEMQVVVNSLTPVLSRRRPNKNREKFNSENKENIKIKNGGISIKDFVSQDPEKMTSSEMCATWHGPGHCVHSQRPKMGIGMVMSESTPMFAQNPVQGLTKSSSFHSNGTMTMPKNFSKTILDAMHKKYCAHQYSRRLDAGPKSTLIQIHKVEQFVATHSVRKPPQSLQLWKDYDSPSTSGNSSPALQKLQSITPDCSLDSKKVSSLLFNIIYDGH